MASEGDDRPFGLTSRRRFMLAGAMAGGGVMGLAEALDEDGDLGSLWGGMAALNQAFNPAGNLYVGPDSAKGDVQAKSGRIYMATDTQVDYYGDGGTWVKLGIGSASEPAGASHFQSLDVGDGGLSTEYTDTKHLGAVEGRSRPRHLSHVTRQKARQRPTLCIIYDDGRDGEYDFWEKHGEYDMPASSAVQAGDLGGVPFGDDDETLTIAELREMTDPDTGVDWEVLGHGYTGMALRETTLSQSASAGATTISVSHANAHSSATGDFPDPDYTYILDDGTNRETVTVTSSDGTDWTLESGLQNSYGSGTQVWPTDETVSFEVGQCKSLINELGFTATGWVFSGHNTLGPTGRAVVSRYFEWARTRQYGDSDVARAVMDTPLERYALDSVKYDTLSSADRTSFLDEIENNNKLGIAFAHADSASLSDADTFLTAVQSRDIDVLLPSEAVARFETNTPSQPPAQKVPENELRFWYPMVNEDASTILDASGRGNDATWDNPANYVTGPYGRAAKFPAGTSDNLSTPADASMQPGTGDFSLVITVRTFDLDTDGRTYFWFWGGTGGLLDCYWNNGEVNASIDDGSNSQSVSEQYVPGLAGDILQIAVVRDTAASEFGMYLNAAQDSNNAFNNDPTGDVSPSNQFGWGNTGGYEVYDFQMLHRVVERHELQTWLNQRMAMAVQQGGQRYYDGSWTEQVHVDPLNQVIDLNGNVVLKDPSHNDTDDSMTADPETATESGYIEIDIGGTTRQIPFYDA